MSEAAVTARGGGWRVEDLDRLPEDGQRYEIIDGSLLMSPPPSARHQGVAGRLAALLRAAAPADLEVVEAAGVRIGSGLLIPDVLVASSDAVWRGESLLPATEVRLAVEVVSPSSLTSDRITKPSLYAAAGIPHYWRVETAAAGGLSVVVYRLGDGIYTEHVTVPFGDTVRLAEPFPLTLAPATLVR
ncbi:Uma2 family endonuclease [soil metagenome]